MKIKMPRKKEKEEKNNKPWTNEDIKQLDICWTEYMQYCVCARVCVSVFEAVTLKNISPKGKRDKRKSSPV